MRKIIVIVALALTLATLTSTAAGARSFGLEVGAFGGISIPVLNDLSKQGTQFGIRAPMKFLPWFSVEPFYVQSGLGDATQTVLGIDYTRDGGDLTGFGANAMFTSHGSVRFFPYAGLGSYTLKRAGVSDATDLGYQVGFGVAFGLVTNLSMDVRGEALFVKTDETSQKYGNVTVGLNYTILH